MRDEVDLVFQGAKKSAKRQRKAVNVQDLTSSIETAVMAIGNGPELRQRVFSALSATVDGEASELQYLFGMQFSVYNVFASQWYSEYPLSFATQPAQTTSRAISQNLMAMQQEGWGIDKMQGAISDLFSWWLSGTPPDESWITQRTPPHRTEMIARTEAMRAANSARSSLMAQGGVKQKEWVAAIDGRERPEHQQADGQIVAMSEPFLVGGEKLMFPGDPAGSPGNTINCRCTVVPVIPEEPEVMEEPVAVPIAPEATRPPSRRLEHVGRALDGLNLPFETLLDMNAYANASEETRHRMVSEALVRETVLDVVRRNENLRLDLNTEWFFEAIELEGEDARYPGGAQSLEESILNLVGGVVQGRAGVDERYLDLAMDTLRRTGYALHEMDDVAMSTMTRLNAGLRRRGGIVADKNPDVLNDGDGFPTELSRLVTVRNLGGSTGAVLVEDPVTKNKFVMKRGASPGHLREEFLADQLYTAFGANVPPVKMYETSGGPVKLSRFIEGQELGKLPPGPLYDKAMKSLREGFAADAFLGNWDVLGMGRDNILVTPDGKAWRIDNGGSLRYRAQGKTKACDEYLRELWTMRDPQVNRNAADAFGSIPWSEVMRQMDSVVSKFGKSAVRDLVPADLRDVLIRRSGEWQHLAQPSHDMVKDGWKEEYVDGMMREISALRAERIHTMFPTKLLKGKGRAKGYLMVDENGALYDHLRGHGSVSDAMMKFIDKSGGNRSVLFEWASGQAGSSTSPVSLAYKLHLEQSRATPAEGVFWPDVYPFAASTQKRGRAAAQEALDAQRQKHGTEIYRKTHLMWHAFVYETLANIEMPNTDRRKQTVDLIRTESDGVIQRSGIQPGESGVFPREPYSSTSLLQSISVHGKNVTITEVPWTRIVGVWLHSRDPSWGQDGFFYGDRENEFVAILGGLKVRRK